MNKKAILLIISGITLIGCQDQGSLRRSCERSFADWQNKVAGAAPNQASIDAMSELKNKTIDACMDAGGWDNMQKKFVPTLDPTDANGTRVSPAMINDLKAGHMKTCVPNISRQLESVNGSYDPRSVELYCECLGNFYFNQMSAEDVKKLVDGQIPEVISSNRTAVQNRCADLHFRN